MTNQPASQSLGEMLEAVLDLIVGGTAVLLPAFILALPCVVLVVVPVLVAGAVAAVGGALLAAVAAPPYLLVRALRRR